MRLALKIEGPFLTLRISEVDNTPQMRGRVANMEIELLKLYGSHKSEPVQVENDKLVYQFVRGDSDHAIYMDARQVLKGFNVEWLNGRDGIVREECCNKCIANHHEKHPGNAKARRQRDMDRGDIKALRREQEKQERSWQHEEE